MEELKDLTFFEKIRLRFNLPSPKFFVKAFNVTLKVLSGLITICVFALSQNEFYPEWFATVLKSLVAVGFGAIIASYVFSQLTVEWEKVSDNKIDRIEIPSIEEKLAGKQVGEIQKELSE